MLSLCMIVKNEEQQIEQCLRSVVDLADEIIVVDTGSDDRTKEICRQHAARIYDYPWDGSFANARNFGLRQAKTRWILWMDADEQLEIHDRNVWEEALNCKKQLLWAIPIINYIGKEPADITRAYRHSQWRMFRNGLEIQFVNRIHEQLDISAINVSVQDIRSLPAVIHHYGYMDESVTQKNKHMRNMELLQKEAEKAEYNPWIDYHLASEYYRIKEYKQTFDQLNKAIMHFIRKGQVPPSLLYKLKYDTLLALGSVDGALAGIDKAIELYTDYVDLHYYKGILLYLKGEFKQAKDIFLHCVTLGENHPQYLIMSGVGSFHALYMAGLCNIELNRLDQANEMFAKAVALNPNYQVSIEEISKRVDN